MWILLNDAFLSVTVATNMPEHLCVRARRQEDLDRFAVCSEILPTPDRDYEYRAIVSREMLTAVMAKEIKGIDYDNFKDSVKDDVRHDAYSSVWGSLLRLGRTG